MLKYFSISAQEMDAYRDRKLNVPRSVRFFAEGAIALYTLTCTVSSVHGTVFYCTVYTVQ